MTNTGEDEFIVFIHGLWLTPLSWEDWVARLPRAGILGPHTGISGNRRGAPRESLRCAEIRLR